MFVWKGWGFIYTMMEMSETVRVCVEVMGCYLYNDGNG